MTLLKNKAIRSVLWSSVERFSVQGVQFVISLLVARILLPVDYGLVAMLGIFLAVAQTFIDSGFSNALIQKQRRTQADYSTVFYFNILIAFIIYLLLYMAAPWIASFYGQPLLTPVTRVIGLTLVFSSFSIVQQARLTIALNFKLLALISLMAVGISGSVGVWMAYHEYGVWALVAQALVNTFINTLLLWCLASWKPDWLFSIRSFKELFSFGSKLLISGLLHTLYTNLYTLVIGKKYMASELGYYNRAFSFTNVVSGNLTAVITRVIYPIQCGMQNDGERLRSSFLSSVRMACFIVFPLMVGMLVLAKPLVLFLLTSKWAYSVELLRILCLAYMWEILMRINYNILNVLGRTDYTLKSEIYKKVAAFLILLCTLPWGLKILCWGLVLYSWVDLFIITRYTKKLLQVGLWTEIKSLLPSLLLSAFMGGIVYLATRCLESPFSKLFVGFAIGSVFYLGTSWLLHFREIVIIRDFIKRKS